MIAIYDLSVMPTTFDFATWAVVAKSSGANAVHFINDGPIASWKYPPIVAWKRFANIVLPCCNLAGLSFTIGRRQEGREFSYNYGDTNEIYRKTGKIEKLKATQQIQPGYMTITLRNSFRNKFRDSNNEAWTKFKDYLESKGKLVVMLPECEHAPLDVEYRMALYANAEMNFGVSNGPMALCHLSDAPYITLNMTKPDPSGGFNMHEHMTRTGFPPGSQFLFRTDRQLCVWKPDTYENILKAWEGMNA